MKKTLILGMALGLTLTATSALAGTIVGSAHDLGQDANWGDTQSRICVYCHTPHNAATSGSDYLPLWNHTITSTTFNTYDNGTDPTSGMNALNANQVGPGGVSKLCLSCHDGTVAVNAYVGSSGTAVEIDDPLNTDGATYTIGDAGDLSNHHPIGFAYDAVVALDKEIADAARVIVPSTNTAIADLLYAGQFECVTCHDVHGSQNTGEKFLWISNDNSAFCIACHIKDGSADNASGNYNGPVTATDL